MMEWSSGTEDIPFSFKRNCRLLCFVRAPNSMGLIKDYPTPGEIVQRAIASSNSLIIILLKIILP